MLEDYSIEMASKTKSESKGEGLETKQKSKGGGMFAKLFGGYASNNEEIKETSSVIE